jgi:hypothetical protein
LLGVHYVCANVDGDIVIADADSWVFTGTGLRSGDRLRGLLGYEVDHIDSGSPSNIQVLGESPFLCGDETKLSHMTVYHAQSGAYVFAGGTVQWSWGLDDFNAPAYRTSRISRDAKLITRNILRVLGGVSRERNDEEQDGDEEQGDDEAGRDSVGQSDRVIRLIAGNPWPVPADGVVHLPFSVDIPTSVTATVTDVVGRRIASLAMTCPRAGSFEFQWVIGDVEGWRPAPGAYFCRLRAGNEKAFATLRVIGK